MNFLKMMQYKIRITKHSTYVRACHVKSNFIVGQLFYSAPGILNAYQFINRRYVAIQHPDTVYCIHKHAVLNIWWSIRAKTDGFW